MPENWLSVSRRRRSSTRLKIPFGMGRLMVEIWFVMVRCSILLFSHNTVIPGEFSVQQFSGTGMKTSSSAERRMAQSAETSSISRCVSTGAEYTATRAKKDANIIFDLRSLSLGI